MIISILIVIFFASFIITLLPYLESYENEQKVQQSAAVFREQKAFYFEEQEQSEDSAKAEYLPELRDLMETYNQEIYANGQVELVDAWSYAQEPFDLTDYSVEDGIVGLLSIPKIDVELPICLGANYSSLLKGCAVLTQTSMPIGGENTNCVIAAHRGWNETPYVRDIEEVEIGDSIFVENLWETLEYRVTEIRIIYPYETDNILIQPGRDLITIVTCHPYRVNTHRYLVFAERYVKGETEESTTDTVVPSTGITVSSGIEFESSQQNIFLASELPIMILFTVLILLIAVAVCLSIRYCKSHRPSKKGKYLRETKAKSSLSSK